MEQCEDRSSGSTGKPWVQLTFDDLCDEFSEYMDELDRRERVRALMEKATLGAYRKWAAAAGPGRAL